MDKFKKIISNKDLFKVLVSKVPYNSKPLDLVVSKNACLYKESVKILEAIEQLVVDIREQTLPNMSDVTYFRDVPLRPNDPFLQYFEHLKFSPQMFDTRFLQLGANWRRYDNFLKNDFIGIDKAKNSKEVILSYGVEPFENLDGIKQWNPSRFSIDRAMRLVNYFTVQDDSYKNNDHVQAQQDYDEVIKLYNDFDELLAVHQSIYTLVVDIRFVQISHLQSQSESLGAFIQQLQQDRVAVRDTILLQFPHWLRAYIKLEHDYQNGLNLSCILMLRSYDPEQESDAINHLQETLKKNFANYGDIFVSNRAKAIQGYGAKGAVGLIKQTNHKNVELFKYWVLGYFVRIDSFAKLINPQMPFEVNETIDHPNWQQLEVKKQVLSSKKSLPSKSFAQVLQDWKTPKGVWDVKHLSERVVERLLAGQIYYKEFCAEKGSSKQCGDLLFQIEVFIETLLHNRYPAFNEMGSAHQAQFLNARDIQASATQLGQQYLSLVQQVTWDSALLGQIDYLIQNCGLHTWWFGQEYYLRLWEHLQQIFHGFMFNQPVSAVVLAQWNGNLQNVQHYLFSIGAQDKDKRELLEKHYSQCARRHTDIRKYLNNVLEQNCWAYRVEVDARSSKGCFKQSELSKLFTEFMRLAKRAKPCYWLRGYVGIWQESSRQTVPEFKLDVVLFFNDRCQEQLQTIVRDLDQRWNSFLKTKTAGILDLKDTGDITYYSSIKPKILMHSVDQLNTMNEAPNTYHVCLETHDRKIKKLVIEHVVPYFAYRDVFLAPFSQKVPKVLIKGSMPKK